jgi:hypothetical protein
MSGGRIGLLAGRGGVKGKFVVSAAMAAQLMLSAAMAGEPGSPVPLAGGLDPLASLPPFEALPAGAAGGYDIATLGHHVSSVAWLTAGVYAGTLAFGVLDWNWGTTSFNFHDEGFFGRGTSHGGTDKLGHAFSTYLLSDFFTHAIRRRAADPEWAELSGAVLGMGVMTTVEVLDGFSEHGLSWEDLVVDALGAGFSYLRNTVPGLRDKVDFRVEWMPSGNVEWYRPHADYMGQKYLLAFKLAGFDRLEQTPLRYVEVHAGYFARGFHREDRLDGESKRREPYIGVGLNLQELLFGWPAVRQTTAGRIGRHTLQYVQVPYTYIAHPYD